MSEQKQTLLIVAGEASGDLHAANMIKALRKLRPDIRCVGVGGERMAAEGCELIHRIEELSVMGVAEVVSHLRPIFKIFRNLRSYMRDPKTKPDLLVTIDYQEFNLLLAAQAQKAGVPVVHYVSPQVWAWRPKRVHRVARVVNALATLFPFEPDYYKGLEIDVRYVGHPLLDDLTAVRSREALIDQYQLDLHHPVVGLFPGSRRNELRFNLDTMVETALELKRQRPDVQFIVPLAPTLSEELLQTPFREAGLEVVLVKDPLIYDVATVCDAVLCVSGTVSLQVALTRTPMAILYKMAPLTYAIGKRLVKVPAIGLPNIVAGKKIVPEFVQQDASAEALSSELLRQLSDLPYRDHMTDQLTQMCDQMGASGGSENVAQMVLDHLPTKNE